MIKLSEQTYYSNIDIMKPSLITYAKGAELREEPEYMQKSYPVSSTYL